MAELTSRTSHYEELLRRFASGVRAAQLYAPDHPIVGRNVDGLLSVLALLHQLQSPIVIGVVDGQLVVADTPLPKARAGMAELIKRLTDCEIERVAFERGVTRSDAAAFMKELAGLASRDGAEALREKFPHITVGRITTDQHRADGLGGDMAAIRQLYADAVTAAEGVWDSAAVEGKPDMPWAMQAVKGLSEAVTRNRTALMALTAMRKYHNYTFTHMVNVSILTMGQARALGFEGRLLRDFGLAGLMHDIGKVRTPKEILDKTEALTDDEFAIMRRHPVDGAELLRRTPEMPILAPVVAFEHHLRMDGSGYPFGVKRNGLNLATVLCSIADVYDAMRMQRSYQRAFPTERILAVLNKNDSTQFDKHLVRRFVQLLGVYPPGTLARLNSGEIAVVTRIHAPDPYRPRVRVLVSREGVRLATPVDKNLWEPTPEGTPDSVAAPVEPGDYGIDPLAYLQS